MGKDQAKTEGAPRRPRRTVVRHEVRVRAPGEPPIAKTPPASAASAVITPPAPVRADSVRAGQRNVTPAPPQTSALGMARAWFHLRRASSFELSQSTDAGNPVLKAARAKGGQGKTTSITANRIHSLTARLGRVCLLTIVSCGSPEVGDSDTTSPETTSGESPTVEMSSSPTDNTMEPFCGNTVLEGEETCDDGYHNGQYGYCTLDCMGFGPYCGDGVVQEDEGEECDGGTTHPGIRTGGGCTSECRVTVPITALAAGYDHTCVLLETGKVRCWGRGAEGQLGYGNTNNIGDNEMPSVAGDVDVGGVVTQLVAGGDHTCALLSDGKVRCWGSGEFGQLGYGSTKDIGDNETPASAGDVSVGGTVKQIGAGNLHTCALLTTGSVRCWGWSRIGQLGYGNTEDIGDDETPADAGDVPVGESVEKLFVGGPQTCSLMSNGKIRCWGQNFYGQLGYNLFAPGQFCQIEDFSNECASSNPSCCIGDQEIPSSMVAVDAGGEVLSLAVGSNLLCALLYDGVVRCWGLGIDGGLGYGHIPDPINSCPYDAAEQTFCGEPACCIGDNESPLSLGDVSVGGSVVQLSSSGSSHVCAVLGGGDLRCWGLGSSGQLGYGNIEDIGDDETPASVAPVDVGGKPIQIVTGDYHTCVRLEGDLIRCWGQGRDGKLGYGSTMTIGDMPGQMPPPNVEVF
jgi:alpha-tubulin suppressor-like RCC1 family protein